MQYRKITEIKKHKDNPRKIKGEEFDRLCRSIANNKDYFEARPIILSNRTDELVIIAGNQRYEAAKHLGLKEVPTYLLPSLSEAREKEIMIRDNVSSGDWDLDLLQEDWNKQDLQDWGIDLDSFGIEEEPETLEAIEDDFNEEPPPTPITVFGDLYEIGEHRLLCGDSTDSDQVSKLMAGEKADMVFTDPDFSMKEDDLFACYSNEKIINPAVSFWICGDKQAIKLALNDFENFTHFFVHDFKCATLVSNTQPMQRHNLICKFGNKKMINLKDGFTTIVSVATERTLNLHKLTPMSKRTELPGLFISHYADEAGIVVDIFLHSGSTMVAAHQLKRKCYGIEIDPKYCDVIVKRMKALDPTLVIKRNGEVINGYDLEQVNV